MSRDNSQNAGQYFPRYLAYLNIRINKIKPLRSPQQNSGCLNEKSSEIKTTKIG